MAQETEFVDGTEFVDELGDAAMLAAAKEIETLTESAGWKIQYPSWCRLYPEKRPLHWLQ